MIDPAASHSLNEPSRRVSATRPSTPAQRDPAPAQPPARDSIDLSEDARRLGSSESELERARLVARLREQVNAGTYRPDSQAIARRIAEAGDL